MKTYIRSLAFLVLLSLPGLAVDATMLNLVMPDAAVVTGANVDEVLGSPLGMHLLGQAGLDDPKTKAMLEMIGFDPRRDLREFLAASTGSGKGPGSILVVRGSFDLTSLMSLAGTQGGAVTSYEGVTVITGKGNSGKDNIQPWIGFLNGAMAVAGPEPDVKAALDRWRSGKTLDATLAARIQAVAGQYDAWMLSTTSPAAFGKQFPNQGAAQMFSAIESFAGGVRLGANIEVSAEALTRSAKDAEALVAVFQFFTAMAAPKNDPAAKGLLDSMKGTVEGRSARFTLTAPESEIEKMLSPRRGNRAVI